MSDLERRCQRSAEIILKMLTTNIEELGGPMITVHHPNEAERMIASAVREIFLKVEKK